MSPMEQLLALRGPAHGTRLFGVFDGARHERVAPMCQQGVEHACLYRGDVDPRLQAVAPWIVAEGDETLAALIDEGVGRAWGFVGECRGDLAVAMRHWRGLLKVRAGGQEVLFRFYDPRVLRTYLPSLDKEGAQAFFGPFRRLFVEAEDGQAWLSMRPGEAGVESTRHPLDGKEPA